MKKQYSRKKLTSLSNEKVEVYKGKNFDNQQFIQLILNDYKINVIIINTEDYNKFMKEVTNVEVTNVEVTNVEVTNVEVTNVEVTNVEVTNAEVTNPEICVDWVLGGIKQMIEKSTLDEFKQFLNVYRNQNYFYLEINKSSERNLLT